MLISYFQLVACYPSEAESLTTNPDIKHITFIGSETVGRKVAMAATLNLTPITLELGGKDACVILPRTDIKKWSSVWMRGALYAGCPFLIALMIDCSRIFM